MPLTPGTRLGVYEVVALLGAGGMGEVYRARDPRLGRDVALKVLPALFATDPERFARFKREAQVLASLNHPNIAAIHGFEESDGTHALVLELIDGPTLADRIAQGRLPLDEALPIARQIAEALEAAHERGVIHRDLKPANIKLRPDGRVKVLDFGLAKAVETDPTTSLTLSISPTTTSPAATRAGMILGTAVYMSPEQARGKALDKRSDIWSFGCVLYEMLAGTRPFDGESVTDVLARIIEREPDYNALPATVPPTIRRLLRRCLEKDRHQRLPDIGAARLDIDEVRAAPAGDVAAGAPARRGRERAIWAAALVATAIAAATAAWYARPAPPPAEVRFEIPARPMRWANEIDISPDGRRVAYAAATDSGDQGLWVRDLNAVQSRFLPGTEAATGDSVSPRWSPDGRSIVFSAGGDLKTVNVDGGTPQTIVKGLGGQMSGATWNRDGVIVFASNNHGLRRVAATGGEVTAVSERDSALGETYHDAPFFLPDQRRFLYLAWSASRPEHRAVYVGSLDNASRARLMPAESQAVYAQGHLLFLRGGTLMARPFDPDSLQFSDEALAVADRISVVAAELGAFSASANGALIYKAVDSDAGNRQLLWMDRDGKAVPASDGPFEIAGFSLAPDDARVVFTEGNPPDVWVYDVVRRVKSRLTTDPAIDHNPVWSADGSRVLFDSHRRVQETTSTAAEGATIYEKASNGATPERLLLDLEPGGQQSPLDSSRDGRTIVFRKVAPTGVWNLWVLPLDGDRKPVPYRVGPFNETEARLSPDGRWLAYSSNESGRAEVIVQPFPDPSGGKWQISTDGGVTPRWRGDGRELFYLDASGRVVAAAVTTGSTFTVERVNPLFRTPLPLPIIPGGALGVFDVTSDGKKFLVAVPPAGAAPAPINVVLNWTAAVTRER